jgi:hypothetical protein
MPQMFAMHRVLKITHEIRLRHTLTLAAALLGLTGLVGLVPSGRAEADQGPQRGGLRIRVKKCPRTLAFALALPL